MFRKLSFGLKLMLIMVLLSLLSIAVVGWLGYDRGKEALQNASFAHLTAVREIKKQSVESYFKSIRNQISTLSKNLMTIEAMVAFDEAFKNLGFKDKRMQDEADVALRNYYQNEFLTRLNKNLLTPQSYQPYWPGTPESQYLQYYYIHANTNPTGSKHLLDAAADGSAYSKAHALYHEIFREYLTAFGLYDVFLVEPENGNIVYTVFKEIDFSTSLVNGPYKNTNIAEAFNAAKRADKPDFVYLADYEEYAPSYSAPASFISSPIFKNGKLIGVLIFQVPIDMINNITTNEKHWVEEGLGNTGETYLVGKDMLMRSVARGMVEDPTAYIQTLKDNGMEQNLINRIKQLNTTILLQEVKTQAVQTALSGVSTTLIQKDFRGKEVLAAVAPIDILGNQWGLVAKIDADEAFEDTVVLGRYILLIAFIICGGATVLAFLFTRSIVKPVMIVKTMADALAKGQMPEKIIDPKNEDEIGKMHRSMNALALRLKETTRFAKAIGKGDLNHPFEALGEDDEPGTALVTMRNNLQAVAESDALRNWYNRGMTTLSELLRDYADQKAMLNRIALFISQYIEAEVVVIYLTTYTESTEQQLVLTAHNAADRYRLGKNTLTLTEGLTGRAIQTRTTLHITDVPPNYLNVISGLGESSCKELLIVPIFHEKDVLGVIEIGMFNPLKPHQIEFVQKAIEAISSTIIVQQSAENTKRLLEQTKKLYEEVTAQEEEIRQNAEELAATNEELERRNQQMAMMNQELVAREEELRQNAEELAAINEELERRNQQMAEANKQLMASEAKVRKNAEELAEANKALALQNDQIQIAQQKTQTELQNTMAKLQVAQSEVEAQRANLELEHANFEKVKRDAERANRIKAELLANMSYELRTPLDGVLGYSQILLQDRKLPQNYKDKIAIINTSGEHLLALINQVLDLSKIETGQIELNEEGFDLKQFMREVFSLFEQRAEKKDLRFDYDIAPNVPQFIFADQSKVRQCLINLVDNAIKYSEKGGVNYKVEKHNDNQLKFSVTDTGKGIAEERLDDIAAGTGLGLALTKNLIELMGGTLKIESRINVGSTFSFTVNFLELEKLDQPPKAINRQIIGIKAPRPYKILIVDDDIVNRDVANEILLPLGFQTTEAENGHQAVEVFKSFQPDLILMDIRMPVMGGFEATEIIRKDENGKKVKILAITASTFEYNRHQILFHGCNDFLVKPYRQTELLDALQRHLPDLKLVYDDGASLQSDQNPLNIEAVNFSEVNEILSPESRADLCEQIALGNFAIIQEALEPIDADSGALFDLKQLLVQLMNEHDLNRLEMVAEKLKPTLT